MENQSNTSEVTNAVTNKVELIGHIGQQPKLIKFESGRHKATFSLAVSEGYKNASGEYVTNTQWVNVCAWGKLAEHLETNFQKGNKIKVLGKLNNRTYQDKDGNTKYTSEVQIHELILIPKKLVD